MLRALPFALVVLVFGCGTGQQRPDALLTRAAAHDAARPLQLAPPGSGPIYYSFDEHQLDDEAQRTLASVARYMAADTEVQLRIEGHCDELGTLEYNLALGQERARAARDYLVALGVEADRLRVVSFGEERPVLFESDELARAKNRRGELTFVSGPDAQLALDDVDDALDVVLAWALWDER